MSRAVYIFAARVHRLPRALVSRPRPGRYRHAAFSVRRAAARGASGHRLASTHMNCDRVLRGKIVNVIERVGVPIGVVKDLRGISPQARWAPVEIAHDHSTNPDAGAKPHG